MGILSHIKQLAPETLYFAALAAFVLGLIGKGKWALLLVIFLIPLRNVIEKILEFPMGNQIIDILIAGALISWLLNSIKQPGGLFAPASLNYATGFLIIYTFLSLLLGNNYLTNSFAIDFSDDRAKDWKNFCLMPVLFLITLNLIKDREWILRVLAVMLMSIALAEYYTVDQIQMYSALVSREKISGTFQFLGPNEVAAFFNECTIIMLGVFFCLKFQLKKWLLLAMILINLFCIIFLYSRGAYLGLMAGMAFIFLFKQKKLLLPLILVAVFWQSVLPEKAVERIKGTENQYGQLDESSQRRLNIWHQGIELFNKSPLTGIGYGVFRNLGLDLGDTHNIYVKILVEQGVVGIIVFFVTILCFLRMGYMLYKKGEDDLSQGMGLGLMACVIVLLVNNFFGDRWTYFELSAYVWVFAGLVGRFTIISKNPPVPAESQPSTQPVKSSPPKIKKKIRYYDL